MVRTKCSRRGRAYRQIQSQFDRHKISPPSLKKEVPVGEVTNRSLVLPAPTMPLPYRTRPLTESRPPTQAVGSLFPFPLLALYPSLPSSFYFYLALPAPTHPSGLHPSELYWSDSRIVVPQR